jgi:lipoprotein-releasing system permease protein
LLYIYSWNMGAISFIGNRFVRIYKGSFSGPVIRIATAGIALSVAVMVVSIVIVKGFQLEIRNKVIGFSGHVRIKPYQVSVVEQQIPMQFDRQDILQLKSELKGIISVRPTAEKAGIIKTDEQIEGCILKGVNQDYDKEYMESSLIEGKFPDFATDSVTNNILISSITASRLGFKTGDFLRMYFLLPGEQQPRGRRFIISGIYDTGLSEFDKKYMFGDIRHIQALNGWESNESGSIEILIDKYGQMEQTAVAVARILEYDLEVWNVKELYPEIFNWLDLLDMNVTVIIIIMLVVAMINIITILLIRILEKTTSIGIMKSFGVANGKIRQIFLYISGTILLRGMLIGNAAGLAIALVQSRFHLISLDQETYYVSTVPVHFDWGSLLLINLLVLLSGIVFMVFPSMIISRIYPAQTLRIK